MIHRRQLLGSLGAIGTATMLSGCTDQTAQSDSEPESNSNTTAETASTEETVSGGLEGIAVDNINLTYNFSSGLRARIELRNQREDDTSSVNVAIAAYNGDQLLGEADVWEDFSSGYIREIDLTIESIGSLADHDIDEVTRFVITGRFEGQDPVTIREFDGETLRERVDTDE